MKLATPIIKAFLIAFSIFAILWGLKLRFSNLNLPFWADELMVVRVGRGLNPATGQISLGYSLKMHQDEHMLYPPLVNVVLYYWLQLNQSVIWIRLLPSLIGILGLFYLYRLGITLGYRLPAILLTAALVSSSWVFVHYSEEVAAHGPGITAGFMLIFYFIKYRQAETNNNFIKLLTVAIIGTQVGLGNWLLLFPIVPILAIDGWRKRGYEHCAIFIVIVTLLTAYITNDFIKYRAPWALAAPYLHRLQLNSVPMKQIPIKFINDNLDYLTYLFGASPWYKDADYFPSVDRFGLGFTVYYYLSLLAVCSLFIITYLIKIFLSSNKIKSLFDKLIPIYFLTSVMLGVNILSLLGKYPIGPYRQSLFYAPLVIWVLMHLLDMVLKRINLLSIVLVGVLLLLIVNNLTRLSRVPQRHIGEIAPIKFQIPLSNSALIGVKLQNKIYDERQPNTNLRTG